MQTGGGSFGKIMGDGETALVYDGVSPSDARDRIIKLVMKWKNRILE